MSKNTEAEISHNLKIRFDVNCIYVSPSSALDTVSSPSFGSLDLHRSRSYRGQSVQVGGILPRWTHGEVSRSGTGDLHARLPSSLSISLDANGQRAAHLRHCRRHVQQHADRLGEAVRDHQR